MKRKLDAITQTVTFTFDGDLDKITLAMKDVSPANATYAMLHGFAARVGDGAALSRKQKDGSVIDVTEKMRRDEILRMVEHYASGTTEWDLGRTTPIDPRAVKLAGAKGISIEEAKAILAKIEMDALTAAMSA